MKNFLKITALCALVIGKVESGSCQDLALDTLPVQTLDSVLVNSKIKQFNATYMTDVSGTRIYAGKRTNTVTLSNDINGLSFNLGRTALAKIPGLTMWEMDGAGTQLNIGTRGTDSHRSIEMNMRQNGYNTNSDLFGYPEDHYTVPLQAVQEIQLVRGSAALQFGPQFGGMLNYQLKEGDTTRVFGGEMEQTAGANGFFNSFNAVGGRKGRFDYYAFYDNRHGDGWRDNASFHYQAYHLHLGYQLGQRAHIKIEYSRMDYVQQIAGGLTDAQFKQDPRQSVRSRNYFQPVINIPAAIFTYDFTSRTRMEITSNGLFGQRNSVQFINTPNIPDTVNTTLHSYNPRQVDRDYYSGFTTEARVVHLYQVGKVYAILSGGIRYFQETTKRRQKGSGTTANDFDLSLARPYGIDLHLSTNNYAAFAENIFQVSPRLSITPGFRYEIIRTNLHGVINNVTVPVSYLGKRNFPLFGLGIQYEPNSHSQFFGNISQAYRPYLYANVTPADRVDRVDPSLKDSKGFDIDLGYRGHIRSVFQFDLDAFYLFYGNKIGLVSEVNPGGTTNLLTTNIGNSVSAGIEAFGEVSLLRLFNDRSRGTDLKFFTSLAFDHARYKTGSINKGGTNTSVVGKRVENAPDCIVKSGVEFKYRSLSSTAQFSYTGKTFNDAFNTVSSKDGVTGLIPAWHVWDWAVNWKFSDKFHLSGAVNNFTDKKYFNRRITIYPGPGILPADGRTFTVSFGMNF